jgi:hypothetical protein
MDVFTILAHCTIIYVDCIFFFCGSLYFGDGLLSLTSQMKLHILFLDRFSKFYF